MPDSFTRPIPSLTGPPPAPVDGTSYYDTTLDAVQFRENAVWVGLAGGGGAAVAGAYVNKGNLNCSGNPNYPSAVNGDTYYVTVGGKVGGASGKVVEVGDLVICKADNAGGTEASVGTSWFVAQGNTAYAAVINTLLAATTQAAMRSALDLGTLATQSGTIGDYLLAAAAASTYQPLDSDLTAIAALTTTSFGRGLLAVTNAAAMQSALVYAPTDLPYATPLTPNCNDGTYRKITLAGNLTINAPTNPADGMKWKARLTASLAPRTLTLQAAIKIPSASTFTSQVIATGETWIIQLEYNGTAWVLQSLVGGWA